MDHRRDANKKTVNSYRSNTYIGDNLARKLDEPVVHEVPRPDGGRRRQTRPVPQKKTRIRPAEVLLIIVGLAIIIGAVSITLNAISLTNELNNEISIIEDDINSLKILNDSKEYAIESSVDLDYVSQVATTELGMVRSSATQIVTYEVQDSEYIQQVAEIPTN